MNIFKTTCLLSLLTVMAGAVIATNLNAAGMPPPTKEQQVEQEEDTSTEENNSLKNEGLSFSLKDPDRIKAGEDIYRSTCAEYCHGQEPELFINRTGLTELYVFNTIRDGGKGLTPMPPWGEVFSKEEIWEVVAYLKSLGKW